MAYSQNQEINNLPAIGQRLTPTLSAKGDPLIFVDMPEVLYSNVNYTSGMKASYRDTVNGRFRLMYYQNWKNAVLLHCLLQYEQQSHRH